MVCLNGTKCNGHVYPEEPSTTNDREAISEDEHYQTNHIKNGDAILDFTISYEIDVSFCIITILSVMMHFTLLSKPAYHVFNEGYFIEALNSSIYNRFHFEHNPPLLTIILHIISESLGFQTDIADSNKLFQNSVITFYFRAVSAVCGFLIAPLAYLILGRLNISRLVRCTAAVLVLSNQILFIDSRFLSPNPIMILASLSSAYFAIKSCSNESSKTFEFIPVGVSLAVAITSLHSGFITFLFVTIFVGVKEFQKFGDKQIAERTLWKRYFSNVGIVAFLPLIVYYLSYVYIVTHGYKAGRTDSVLSQKYQVSLEGSLQNKHLSTKEWVLDGSKVMLHSVDPQPCYLHSHPYDYPFEGVSKPFQQMTCYDFIDGNNWFAIESITAFQGGGKPYFVRHGDVIKLRHVATEKYIAVHDNVPSVSNEHGILVSGTSDIEDAIEWVVEVTDDNMLEHWLWASNETQVRFRSNKTQNYLVHSGAVLPDWGFNQRDMAGSRDAATIWTVKRHEHPQQDLIDDLKQSRYSTFEKIWELHKILFVTGKYDHVKSHKYDISPYLWLKPGLSMLYSYTNSELIYAQGNTLLEYGVLVCLVCHISTFLILVIRRARGVYDIPEASWVGLRKNTTFLFSGFLFHYSSFFFFQRPLFIFQFQLAYTWLILSCMSYLDTVLHLLSHYTQYTVPVLAAYTTAVFVHFLTNFHYAVGVRVDEDELYMIVD